MTIGLLVVALMGLDTAFAGYRAAAGRTGHIRTLRRSALSMLRGGILGWLAGALLLGSVVGAGGPSQELVEVGGELVLGYGVFGAVIAVGFLARAVPSVDLRAASSIVVFGPLTLIRPVWIVLVAAWASWGSTLDTRLIVFVGVLLVLGIEQLQERVLAPPPV